MKNAPRNILLLFLIVIALSTTGCATLLSSSSKDIAFNSIPTGADIYINGAKYAKTPAIVPLDKDRSYLVEIRKDGYVPQTASIRSRVGMGWIVLDLFSGGFWILIDAITGDWKTLSPRSVEANLTRL